MNPRRQTTHPIYRSPIIALFASALFIAGVTDRAMADCAPSASGLVAWWSGDANATELLGINHGTLQGGAIAGAPGFVSGAFNFDGTNGFVSIPDSPALRPTNFTIEAWIKIDAMDTPSTANAGVQFYVFKQNSRASYFEGYWLGKSRSTGTDTFTFGVTSAGGVFVPVRSSTIQTGVWYHVAAVRGPDYIQLFTNGVLSAQAAVNFPQDYGNQPLYFGSSGVPSYDSKLKGKLDEVSLYNRALSAGEIAAAYASGADGRCKAPIITLQPQGQTVMVGNTANFTTAATGFGALSYQWQLNGSPITSATNALLAINNVQPGDQGNYTVIVSNALGTAVSSVAALTVLAPQPGVPFVSSISPLVGVPGTNLTISGFNFSPLAAGNIVHFGGVRAAIISAGSNSLSVIVPVGALFAPVTVTVGGFSAASSVSFTPTFSGDIVPISNSTLAAGQNLSSGSGVHRTAIADLDGDGWPDLAVANVYAHTVSLFRNLGQGQPLGAATFGARVDFPTIGGSTDNPYGFIAADVDADGKLDLVFTDRVNNRIGIYRNIASPGTLTTSSFTTPFYYNTGSDPRYVRVADLDRDGRPDIVTCNVGDGTISILRNTGSAGALDANTFASRFDLVANSGAYDVAIADFDGDTRLDLAVVNQNSFTISLFRNISTPGVLNSASFAPRVNLPANAGATIAAGDLDGDGRPDLISGGNNTAISVYRNLGSTNGFSAGSFAGNVDYFNPGWVHNVVFGDINGDGKVEVVVVGELGSYLRVYQNLSTSGNITLAPGVDYATGWNAWGVSVGDLDLDSRSDIVFANAYDNTVTLYRNIAPFDGPPFIPTQPASRSVIANSNVTFIAGVEGKTPIAYQWFYNGQPLTNSAHNFGAASNILNIVGAQTNDIGAYWLVATNALGSITSTVAMLDVGYPPAVQTPIYQTILIGSNVVFTAIATGTEPFTYQWQFNNLNLADNARISGSTNVSLSISNLVLSDGGNYRVFVSNKYGSAFSFPADLSIVEPPVIANDPVGGVVPASTNFTFIVGTFGTTPFSYQWRFNQNDLPLATNISLLLTNIQAANAGDYTVVITNLYGSVTSSVAVLVVTPAAPVFTLNPIGRTATKGAEVTFTATAKGSEPISYQWLFNGTNVPGATGSNFVITNAQYANAGIYSALATNIAGASNSTDATLTVTPPPGFLWTRKAGGASADEGRSVARDAQGNIFVAGSFTGSATFGTNQLVSVGSSMDIFLAKYDSFGQLLWVRATGSSGTDSANGIAVDAAGNVCIVGSVGASPTFSGTMLTNIGGADAFVAKYSSAGDLLWVTNFGGTSTDIANAVATDSSGNIYLTGSFNGTGFFGGTIISNTLNGAVFTAKFSADGNLIWVRASAGTTTASGTGIALDTQGNVLVAGSFNAGYATFGSIALTNNLGLIGANGSLDVFTTKYDANGNVLWATKAGGTSNDTARGIAVDGGGNSYVVGEFNVRATFGSTTLTEYPGVNQSPDVFVMKCDPFGNILWAQRGGGTSTDAAGGVAVDGGGNVYITGSFSFSANFGGYYISLLSYPSAGFVGGTNINSAGGVDAFVAMYSTAGELRWVLKAGGTSTDAGRTVLADNSGNLFLSGAFSAATTFGHQSFSSAGSADFFLSKLAAFDPDASSILVVQPVGQTKPSGSAVTLGVGIIAPGPISYQWQFNGADISGATNLSLTLVNIIATNSGAYSVNVTTPNGNLSSTSAVLTVVTEPDFLWAKHLGGSGNDECLAVAADPNGNTYAAGYFSGTTDFGGTNLTSNGGEDAFIAKFDIAQNLVWLRQLGGTNNDRATALALDLMGNVIVAGQFSATLDFNGTNLTTFGSNDVFLAKFDNTGALLWARQAGSTNSEAARDIAIHSNGDIAISGSFQRTADFGGVLITNKSNAITPFSDAFVARYDTDGLVLWAKGSGGTSEDRATGVAFDRAGNVFITGGFNTSATFDNITLNSIRKGLEIFVAKYGPTGNVVWARAPSTASSDAAVFAFDDEATALATDSSGNIFVAGYFQSLGIFGSNTVASASTNAPDLFLTKYDDAGNVLWVRTGGGVATDSALALTTDNSDNALLAGVFTGSAQFSGQTLTGIGGADAFAAMYDATGNLLKLRKLGGMGDDAAQATAYDGRGNLVLGGFHTGASVIGATPLSGSGLRDAFVAKLSLYDPDLTPIITTQPMEQTVGYGKTLDLSVGVTSGSSPSYQWLFNNAPLSGATNGSLRIANFQYAAVGNYSVIVTNAFGTVTSVVATATVELTPEFPWLRRAGGTGDDQALALAMDAQTNLYMAGYFTGTATFTNGFYGTNISLVSAGLTDIFLAKYNSDGQLLWARRAGGSLSDSARAMAVDGAGNVFLAGSFQSATATFGSFSVINSNSNTQEIFVSKYDPQGNAMWVKAAGGGSLGINDIAQAIAIDAAGNAYVTGGCGYLATFGSFRLTNSFFETVGFYTNFFIAKFDNAGDVVWAKTGVSTASSYQGNGITLDANTNVIVTGYFTGAISFGSGFLTNNNIALQGGSEASVFITKYDMNGNPVWAKKGIGGAAGTGQAIRADNTGNIYATSSRPAFGITALVLTKYDPSGFMTWTRGVSQGNGQLQGSSLGFDADGNILMAGGVTGSLTFEGTFLSVNGFISKYRPDGIPLWVLRAGSWCSGVVSDSSGGAYLAGRYSGTGLFGPNQTNFLNGFGGNDIFLVKLGAKPPTATPQAFVKTIATDAGTTLQVTTTGTGPFAYQWRFNGTNISGATSSTYLLNGAKWTNAGLYSVAISNTAGSFVSAPAAVNVTPELYSEPSGNDVKLTWGGQFTLQSSTNPAGPFADIPGATSPYLHPKVTDPLRFFRLKSEPFALTLSNQPGMGMTLSGAGISGYNFILLGSTNLINWSPVTTNISPFSFTETNPLPMRFYRAVMAQ